MTTPHVGRYGSANRNHNGNLQQILSPFSLDDKLWQNKLLGKQKLLGQYLLVHLRFPWKYLRPNHLHRIWPQEMSEVSLARQREQVQK
jgi:hypothetical protein